MKVLTIGMDKDLLKVGSVAHERHRAYAQYVEEFHAVVFARRHFGKEAVQIAEHAWAYPTYSRNTLMLFVDAFRIGKKLLKEKGEWVISAQDPFESGLVAYTLSKVTGAPFLVQEHGDFFSTPYWRNESLANRVRYLFGKVLVRKAHHVRVVSARIADTLQRMGVRKEYITITPVYTDVRAFEAAQPDETLLALKKDGAVLVGTMARFVPQKNLELLIRAFSTAVHNGARARLVLIGAGALNDTLRKHASELTHQQEDEPIVFLDWTNNPAGAIKAMDVYALSSNGEGWGRVCIEALAAGTPVLMTDVGCAGEVIKNEENGIVVPVHDEQAFTNALETLITDTTLRERLCNKGMQTVADLPSKATHIAMYKKSLESCIVSKHREDRNR